MSLLSNTLVVAGVALSCLVMEASAAAAIYDGNIVLIEAGVINVWTIIRFIVFLLLMSFDE